MSKISDLIHQPTLGVYGHEIQDTSFAQTQRPKLNFEGDGVVVSDDSVNNATKVTISGGPASLLPLPITVVNPTGALSTTGWTNETGSLATSGAAYSRPGYMFTGGANALTIARQSLSLLSFGITAEQIDAGAVNFLLSWYCTSWNVADSDNSCMGFRCKASDNTTVLLSDYYATSIAPDVWTPQSLGRLIPMGTRYIEILMKMTRVNGTNNDGYITDITASMLLPTGSGHIIQDDGVSLPVEGKLNFGTGLKATDDSGNGATKIELPVSATAPSNPTTGLLWVDTSTASVLPSGLINLTGASSDYALQVGETAFMDYITVSSFPLRTTLASQGIYEIDYVGTTTVSTVDAFMDLQPNNATTTNINTNLQYNSSSTVLVLAQYTTETVFAVGAGRIVHAKITFYKNNDMCSMQTVSYGHNTTYQTHRIIQSYKSSGCTAWTSLGTLVLSTGTQTGRIIIKRII